MAKAFLHFLVVVVAFVLLTRLVPGFFVRDWVAAAIAALVFGLVNATIGLVLRILTFPLILLTFGIFTFVVNAVLLLFVAFLVPGFSINGFLPALIAAVVLALVNMLWRTVSREVDRK